MAIDDAYPTSASTLSTMAQWEGFFRGFSADGVIPGVLNELVPSLNTGARTAVLGTGAAQVRGFHVDNPSSTATAIPTADTQNRVDRLVLRLDRTASAADDWITPVVIEGTPSATPQIPALSQTSSGDYDIPIARWTSASSGSLTGLVDERQFAAASPMEFQSDARPSATVRRLGFERDTSRVLWANGTAWKTVWDDTGWVTLSMNGPDGGAWTANNVCRIRRTGSLVRLRIAVKRWATNGLALGDPDGSRVISLADQFRPTEQEPGEGIRGTSPVHLRVDPDGTVRIFPLVASIPKSTTVFAGVTYLVD